ncbi:MAG: DegT/DnrJ/EryC1/StrS family aminotransferase [Actinomycetota bacterium]
MTVPFLDLRRETEELRSELRAALEATLDESRFVHGEAVAAFERGFAEFCGARHCVGVGSGTDALAIALRAAGVGPGDEVITAANTCIPTVAGISASGATPVLADVDRHSLTLDASSVADAISPRTRALMPVHLYGRRVELGPLVTLAHENGLRIVEDAAQAHGVVDVVDVAAFSFYPTKNLGALGDAGAIVTSDADTAERARLLREYGGGTERAGQSRLDTVQAAVLSVKLSHVPRWNARRRELAAHYSDALGGTPLGLPPEGPQAHHLYVVRSGERDALRRRLSERGVETLVHYDRAVHHHSAWAELARPGLDESERAAAEVLSLPLYPQLTDDEAETVIEAVLSG